MTAGYNISRNARGEQLIIPQIHGIPKRFSQRIRWISAARGNAAIHNLIPQCGSQRSLRLFHFHPGSGCWPGAHPSLSTDSSKHWAVVSQPSVTLDRARPKTYTKAKNHNASSSSHIWDILEGVRSFWEYVGSGSCLHCSQGVGYLPPLNLIGDEKNGTKSWEEQYLL